MEFFDVNVVNESRNSTYKRLAKIAGDVGVDEGRVFDLLKISDTPGEDGSLNSGNGVTDAVKVLVKMNRLVGIHVTPTVVVSVLFLWSVWGGGAREWRLNKWFFEWQGEYIMQLITNPNLQFNGVVENSISSSFSVEQWAEWLEKNII